MLIIPSEGGKRLSIITLTCTLLLSIYAANQYVPIVLTYEFLTYVFPFIPFSVHLFKK